MGLNIYFFKPLFNKVKISSRLKSIFQKRTGQEDSIKPTDIEVSHSVCGGCSMQGGCFLTAFFPAQCEHTGQTTAESCERRF